jgi:hypothetical protein
MRNDTFIRPGLEVSFKVVNEAADIVPALLASLDKGIAEANDAAVLAKF